MTRSKLSVILASPLSCAFGLLAGITAEDSTHLKPADVEPYHATAHDVIMAWPDTIADGGLDRQRRREPSKSPPKKLLHPNGVINRQYTSGTIRLNGRAGCRQVCWIVQCKDARDMAGHYPPNCYPARGDTPIDDREPFSLQVGGLNVIGFEYHFRQNTIPVVRNCVYDFFIVPGGRNGGFVPDMDGVRAPPATISGQLYGGCNQFQVVMDADYPQELRESIFKTIIGADVQALTVLNTVDEVQ